MSGREPLFDTSMRDFENTLSLHSLVKPKRHKGNSKIGYISMLELNIKNGCYNHDSKLLKEKQKELSQKKEEIKIGLF